MTTPGAWTLADSGIQEGAQTILLVIGAIVAICVTGVFLYFAVGLVVELLGEAFSAFLDGWYWYVGAGILAALIAVAAGAQLLVGASIGVGVAFVWAFLAGLS